MMTEKLMEKYITENFLHFDPVIFLENTANTITLEKAQECFEKAIDSIALDTKQPYNLVHWCKNVKNNNYEILTTDETLYYWNVRVTTTSKLQKNLNKAEQKDMVIQRTKDIGNSVKSKLNLVSKMKRKQEAIRIENDKVLFGSKSVGTTIKNFAETYFRQYRDLSNKQQHVVGLCLNSIIDISNETKDSQRQLFTDNQWEVVKNEFKRTEHYEDDSLAGKLKDINRALKSADINKAYILARKMELQTFGTEDEALYNIYAHIITVYRKRKAAVTNTNNTEMNSLVKIWGEVFETLFPNSQRIYCKWGESKAHNGEFKIDCRVVFMFDEKEVDLTDMEAARYMFTQKVNNDDLKLCVESKDILDFLVKNSTTFNHETVEIFMVQMCMNHCVIKKIYLVDEGLYCVDKAYDLTIPSSPIAFSNLSLKWFQALYAIKNNCDNIVRHYDTGTIKKTHDRHFARSPPTTREASYVDWLCDSFYPPTQDSDVLIMPSKLYPDPVYPNKKQTIGDIY